MSHAKNYITVVLAGSSHDSALMVQAKLHTALAFLDGETRGEYMKECRGAFTVVESGKEVIAKRFLTAEAYATRAWQVVRNMPGVAEVWAQNGAGISLNDAYEKCPKKANVGRTKKTDAQRSCEAWERLSVEGKELVATYVNRRMPEVMEAAISAAEVRKSLSVTTAEV